MWCQAVRAWATSSGLPPARERQDETVRVNLSGAPGGLRSIPVGTPIARRTYGRPETDEDEDSVPEVFPRVVEKEQLSEGNGSEARFEEMPRYTAADPQARWPQSPNGTSIVGNAMKSSPTASEREAKEAFRSAHERQQSETILEELEATAVPPAPPPTMQQKVLPADRLEEPRCRFLISCELGDPISCVYCDRTGCLAGTMQGKVWLFDSATQQATLLAAFHDEGIRGLYMDELFCYATLGDECRSWQREEKHSEGVTICFRSLDRKNTQNVKHVLQLGPWACSLFPVSSTVVHVGRREHHHRAFRLFDYGSLAEVAPCDFDGERLVLVDRSLVGTSPPVLRVVHLELNEQTEINKLPLASRMSVVKLWGNDCVVYVVGNTLHVHDYRMKVPRCSLQGHSAEIVAVDSSSVEIVTSLSTDAEVKMWRVATAECVRSFNIPGASFFLGYPYFLSVKDRTIAASADEGVYLIELEAGTTEV